jgi:exodeoxyribonuclease VII large subunit
LEARSQRLDDAVESLRREVARSVRILGRVLDGHRQRMLSQRPRMRVKVGQQELLRLRSALAAIPSREVLRRRQRLDGLVARLRLLSPQNVLDRGYSLTLDAETGAVVRDVSGLIPGKRLHTRLQSGEVSSVVTRVLDGVSSDPSLK